jgi:hypothetical protein
MTSFTKPVNLNGAQLRDELNASGVTISNDINAVVDTSDGFIHLDIPAKDQAKAAEIVAAHVGIDKVIELSLDEKLASVGISLAEIKAALLA